MQPRVPLRHINPIVVDWRLTTRRLDAIDTDETAARRADDDGMVMPASRVSPDSIGTLTSAMTSGATALPRATGTVRWFDSAKGHGFVTCDGGGPDCFLHQSSICAEDLRQIEEGTRVAFDVLQGFGGPLSVNVCRL